MLLLRIMCVILFLSACGSVSTPALEEPDLHSLRDEITPMYPNSFILMKGRPPQPFQNHWLVIVTYTDNNSAALIQVSERETDSGQRYQVHVGDTIPIDGSPYKILAIEEVDDRLAWVEIDGKPQR